MVFKNLIPFIGGVKQVLKLVSFNYLQLIAVEYVSLLMLMYCRNICDALYPQLHKDCVVLELLIMYNGLRISCHSIINHFHNFAITVNMCTLAENSVLSKLTLPSSIE